MVHYETLILARTGITDDESGMLERHFDKLLTDAKGKLVVFDKWGKYRLAYPVGKDDYGVYILARFELPVELVKNFMKELETFFKIKCNDFAMRYVTVKLPENAGTAYIKPDPIDSGRSTNVEHFMKENKMEGLLGNVEFESTDGRDTYSVDEEAKA